MSSFQLDALVDAFGVLRNQSEEKGAIPTAQFILAYKQLSLLLEMLGTAFSFVKKDVDSKLAILEQMAQQEEAAYETLQGIIQHEVKHRITLKKDKKGGSRNVMRLVRALEFMQRFLAMLHAERQKALSECARKAYDETLALHHPWTIRKAAGLAFYALPYRETFMGQINVKDEAHGLDSINHLQGSMVPIIESIQNTFAKHEIVNLD